MIFKRSLTIGRVGRFLRSRRWFTLYFGLGIPPALFGAMAVSFRLGWRWGIVVNALIVAWYAETVRTACSRCQFYGTAKCGLPGKAAAVLVRRRDPFSLKLWRVHLHRAFDFGVIALVNATWFFAYFPVWPLIAVSTVGGWLTVYRRKRFHGLLYRLRPGTRNPATTIGAGASQLASAAGPTVSAVTVLPARRATQDRVDAARRGAA